MLAGVILAPTLGLPRLEVSNSVAAQRRACAHLCGREPLRQAIRVALGRHHRVILVCPWPPDMPPPGEPLDSPFTRSAPHVQTWERVGPAAIDKLRRAMITRYHEAYEAVRHDLGRVGVPVVNAARGEPVQLILDRMEQLRVAGIRR